MSNKIYGIPAATPLNPEKVYDEAVIAGAVEKYLEENPPVCDIPTVLPNPHALTINGVEYDGSEAVEVNIKAEGGGIVTETDPTVPAWAKASTKPSYTASEVGAVPVTTTVNGKALSSDISLSASDVGAAPSSHMDDKENPHGVTAAQVGARPSTWTPSASEVGATPASHESNKNNPHGVTAAQVGARPDSWMPTATEVGARPNTWMPTANDVGAAPASHVTNKSNPHGVTAAQVGARPNTWNPAFLTDKGNSGYRGGLQYSGSSTGVPKYVAVWDVDDTAGANEPNRVVRAAQADIVRDLIGAAPSGYGYGGTAISLGTITDESALNTALATVYNAMGNNETKMVTFTHYPSNSDWRWFGILSRSSANNGSLIAHSPYCGGAKIIKQKYSGTWQDCEWENPPLAPNTPYRTMMRWNSKPVYVKRIVKTFSNTTIGAASGYSDYEITHGVTGLTTLVRLEGTMDDKIILPYVAGAGGHTFLLQDTGTGIRLRIYCDTWTSPTVSVTMYYTK